MSCAKCVEVLPHVTILDWLCSVRICLNCYERCVSSGILQVEASPVPHMWCVRMFLQA